MSAPPETMPWARGRWMLAILGGFALHLGALCLLPIHRDEAPRQPAGLCVVRWLSSPEIAQRHLDAVLINDPTLFAMVHPRGFSGAAWLLPQSPGYRAAEWTDTERSLAQPTQLLGGAFQQIAPAGPPKPVFDLARKPAANPPLIATSQPQLRSASSLRVEGPVRMRKLAPLPPLRSWPHTDLLADTRVQILVNPEGLVFTSRLAGAVTTKDPVQRDADLHALELARQFRFEPAAKNSRGSVEGVLVFQWHTTEPSVTAKP